MSTTTTNYLIPQTTVPYPVYGKICTAYIPGTKALPASFLPFNRVVPATAKRVESAVFSNEEGLFVYIPLAEAEAIPLAKVNGLLGLIINPLRHLPTPVLESSDHSLRELKTP